MLSCKDDISLKYLMLYVVQEFTRLTSDLFKNLPNYFPYSGHAHRSYTYKKNAGQVM